MNFEIIVSPNSSYVFDDFCGAKGFHPRFDARHFSFQIVGQLIGHLIVIGSSVANGIDRSEQEGVMVVLLRIFRYLGCHRLWLRRAFGRLRAGRAP